MTPSPSLPVCNSLWIGTALGALERTCLGSFVDVGHPVHLFAYDDVGDVPAGVEVCDAEAVLPRAAAARYLDAGKRTVLANYFRYALQRAACGLWVDCDVLCLRPLPDAPVLFGRQGAVG